MADVYLAVQSNRPGSSLVVLINGEPSTTGYKIDRAGGVDLGSAAWDKTYSGPRGTQGAKLVGATAQNRLSTWMLQAIGSSEDDLQRLLSQLWSLDEDCRRYEGTAYWRAWGSSFLMELEVLDSGVGAPVLDADLWPKHHIAKVPFGLVTPPYMSGPCMDIVDDFSSDSESDYTFDAGSASDLVVTGGQLTVTANPTTEKRLIHTGVGYQYSDVQATVKAIPGSTISSFLAGVVLGRFDANNYIRVYVDDTGVNSRLRIDVVNAGVVTNRASTNLAARVVNGTAFWVRGRIEGNNLFAEYFTSADWFTDRGPTRLQRGTAYTGPTPMQAPTSSTSYTLSTAEQIKFGETTTGQVGLDWIPQQSAAVLDDFVIEPYVYRAAVLPNEPPFTLRGIPGDAPALFDAVITPSGGSAPIWASLGWWPRVTDVWNRVWNGDFESLALVGGGGPSGWSVAAVTNINGAATSIARIGTASKYGTFSGQIVCPATSGTGANFRIFRRFRKGVTYTAECWIHSAAGVTSTSIRLGNGAANDKATSGGVALSATWQRITVTWTPTADYDDAHVAVIINAATATTFEIDGVMVYEGTVAPSLTSQTEGRGGFPPFGLIEAENSSQTGGAVANANFRSGFGGGAGNTPQIVIDPALIAPDDYSDSIAIEVWARVELIFGSTAGNAVLMAQPLTSTSNAPVIYSDEFGAAGKTIVMPSAGTHRRLTRLGTLRIPSDGGRVQLLVGSTNAAFDYFVLLPAGSRALSPSGRINDSSYPEFVVTSNETTRRIRSDLSGRMREPATGAPDSAAPGLGGSLLELSPGDVELLVKLSSMVPDDPTVGASDEALSQTATVHLAVTPRFRLGRSS